MPVAASDAGSGSEVSTVGWHRSAAAKQRLRRRIAAAATFLTVVTAVAAIGFTELRTSALQAVAFSQLAQRLSYDVAEGASAAIRFPQHGPYDRRLGYVDLPEFVDTLRQQGYSIKRQARISSDLAWYIDRGGYAPYHARPDPGLTLLDRLGQPYYRARQPERAIESFEAIPPLIVDTLLFIENRELLDPRFPVANPAVEWDRLAGAMLGNIGRAVGFDGSAFGGSTLATQLEKLRHSPGGRTVAAAEKLQQMIAASLRGYLHGPDTRAAKQRIVVDYLNEMPLAARPGFGEVIGLGDGLWVWFGVELDDVIGILAEQEPAGHAVRALAYRQLLTLLLAQRRPSAVLGPRRAALDRLTDAYLRLLEEAGVIGPALEEAALSTAILYRDTPALPRRMVTAFAGKAAVASRLLLLEQIGLASLYDLDRLDLTVETTIDADIQARVTETLQALSDEQVLESMGLLGPRLLGRDEAAQVVYSFVLLERGDGGNRLRVQADSQDLPFDVNDGAKLDLGSTAKLRTLISYLEIVAELHADLSGRSPEALRSWGAEDPLTRWVADRLAVSDDVGLAPLLEAAMQRRYSADTSERFFTAGGTHRFANFDSSDSGRVLTVAEAFRNSVNLVFIRLMRDIVRYHVARIVAEKGDLFDLDNPVRQDYLRRFADREGAQYLSRFHRHYRGFDGPQRLVALAARTRRTEAQLAVVFRSVHPEADAAAMASFIAAQRPGWIAEDDAFHALYGAYARDRFSLNDRAYLAGVHPLELWLVAYLADHPDAPVSEVLAASADVRQEAYGWLFRTSRRFAQDRRIRTLLEEEAFVRIHASWQRLGYPFDRLVPSYATAIGTSGDRPAALAELIGIIVNGGVARPTVRLERLRFAEGTPYETVLTQDGGPGERVLPREVAEVVRRGLIDVVERGTGRRVTGAFVLPDGEAMMIGGKTGTGDHRFERFARGGVLIDSRVISRSATFVFFLDDRFFGTVTAHVTGPRAGDYRFTSALSSQLLKALAPVLLPLIDESDDPETTVAQLG